LRGPKPDHHRLGTVFFRNQRIIVVGGGDSAMEEATFLTRFAETVTIVHRRDTFRASKVMQVRALNNPKITVEWNSVVEEILGAGGKVTGARLRNRQAITGSGPRHGNHG
jgi:thioredoxin reductase (NADPH)